MRTRIQGKKLRNSLVVLALSSLFLIILSACGGAATEAPLAPAEPAEPAAPKEPPEPVEPSDQYPVTYGQDSRIEVFQHTDTKLQEMAASVAIFVHKDQVKISRNSVKLQGYTLNEMSEMGWLVKGANAPMCPGESFTSQTAPGFCTGFLVEEDILVTAGHCLEKTACSNTSIVFGFRMESDNSMAALTRDNVFKCAEVIAQVSPNQDNQYLDYAIIKLDRPTGRAGLDYVTDDHLKAQDLVAVLGYPSGLPMKIASDAFVISNRASDPFFVANLDTFGSNSGSPVINTDNYQVEGVLVRGMTDYVLSDDQSCIRVNRCPESGGTNCAGENATKMAMLAEQIPTSTAAAPNKLPCFPTFLFVFAVLVLMRLKPR
ncbi:MAG: trypsin-like peptidase domain-containing protein [Anaerolineales bacterium]|nr:trypsin-like peptidase domain-containing protein [Anaerolineales bacterium]